MEGACEGEPARLVQYVILRKDLTKKPFSWPAGSQIAQACHVVSKTLWELKDEPNVQAYMADIDNMHKVTLAAPDEDELKGVIAALSEKGLHFRRYVVPWSLHGIVRACLLSRTTAHVLIVPCAFLLLVPHGLRMVAAGWSSPKAFSRQSRPCRIRVR
jgi:hypothetical protein